MDALATAWIDCQRPDVDLRAGRHADVELAGVTVPDATRRSLGASLAVFQVGESGTGQHLFDAAAREGAPAWYVDELRHVEFHAATLPRRLARFTPPVAGAVRLLWNVLVTGTSIMVAVDHGAALRLAGVGRMAFVADVWRLRADLDHRLFGHLDEIRACRP